MISETNGTSLEKLLKESLSVAVPVSDGDTVCEDCSERLQQYARHSSMAATLRQVLRRSHHGTEGAGEGEKDGVVHVAEDADMAFAPETKEAELSLVREKDDADMSYVGEKEADMSYVPEIKESSMSLIRAQEEPDISFVRVRGPLPEPVINDVSAVEYFKSRRSDCGLIFEGKHGASETPSFNSYCKENTKSLHYTPYNAYKRKNFCVGDLSKPEFDSLLNSPERPAHNYDYNSALTNHNDYSHPGSNLRLPRVDHKFSSTTMRSNGHRVPTIGGDLSDGESSGDEMDADVISDEDDPVEQSRAPPPVLRQSDNLLLQDFYSSSLWLTEGQARDDRPDPDRDVSRSPSPPLLAPDSKTARLELKATGQSYVNTKGRVVEAKRVGPQDCSKCPLQCASKIASSSRQRVFAEYWGLADHERQRRYLAEHMHREEKLGPSGLTRTVVLYYLTHHEDKMQVCRQFFLKTLDVTEKASRLVLEKKLKGEFGEVGCKPAAPSHRTTATRSRRTVATSEDKDYQY